MNLEEIFTRTIAEAKAFGADSDNHILRKNISKEQIDKGSGYFGLISPDNNTSGPYADFSFVVFPNHEKDPDYLCVGLVVGTEGFKNDYSVAALPGLRRKFLKLNRQSGTFVKTDFSNINNKPKALSDIMPDDIVLKNVMKKFGVFISACVLIELDRDDDPDNARAMQTLFQWLAMYADFRDWGNAEHRKLRKNILDELPAAQLREETGQIRELLESRRYVVLQGAPGCGKTYTALRIADGPSAGRKEFAKTFFTQFHAETTYSDFVCGLTPDTSAPGNFKMAEGTLCKAMRHAADNPREKVLLIIDEINRANLSNVLGPVFYLFEHQADRDDSSDVKISINGRSYTRLPKNLYVLATMNTADRSLAVVDFALRRRFAWFSMHPHTVKPDPGYKFDKKLFEAFSSIFNEYASDEELSLQPGQSYFIFKTDNYEEERKQRIIYELMPLIKEYLAEGFLTKALDEFADLFYKETGRMMYE